MRQTKYSALVDMPVVEIPGGRGFYEEVSVNDSTMDVSASGGNSVIGCKEINVNIYKDTGNERRLCASLRFHRVDPSSFDESFGMVANDFESDSHVKAMSADAFKELTDSKVTNDKDYTGIDKTLSALAFKEYLKEKLVSYAKISDSVWYDGNVQLGSDHQEIYVDTDGKAKPVNVIYRGNRTNDENALVIVPTLGADGL